MLRIVGAALLLALSIPHAKAQVPTPFGPTPVGLWRTIDDKTGQARSIVRIFEAGGLMYGRVETILDPTHAHNTCDKCTGDRKGKPLLGLDFMRGLKPADDGGWSGGEIVDPETGSSYRAAMKLADGGNNLVVRGYIMVQALGRSQTWTRVTTP